jgi:hypothetical protein
MFIRKEIMYLQIAEILGPLKIGSAVRKSAKRREDWDWKSQRRLELQFENLQIHICGSSPI